MNSLSLASIGILVENGNCGAMLGLDYSTSHHYGDIGNLMVINTRDIDCSIRYLDDMNVITSYATVGTSVNK